MNQLSELTPFLYVPFAAWAIAQLIKFTLSIIKGDVNIRYLYASGGMPSVHSAVVCSLATWALIDGGVASPLFGITAVFAAIVMYDSFGVRRSAGDQARTLNRLINDLSSQGNLKNSNDYSRLREILGHKPLEVVVGATLGIFIACAFGYNKIISAWPIVLEFPNATQSKWLLIIAGIILLSAPIAFFIGYKKYRNNKKVRGLILYVAYGNAIFGALLATSAFLAYENLQAIVSQWWFVGLATILWLIYDIIFKSKTLKAIQASKPSADDSRKAEWIKKSKKSKKKKGKR